MRMTLRGIGCATPIWAMDQETAADMVLALMDRTPEEGWHVRDIYRNVGVRQRHSAMLQCGAGERLQQSFFPKLCSTDADRSAIEPGTAKRMAYYQEHAALLASKAAAAALANADISPQVITHLVTVSCTGFAAPGVDCALITDLGLPLTVERTNVGFMGCHGSFNGLRVARGFVGSEPNTVVLTVAVELCSLHFDYGWELEHVVANALFADGSAAVVGVASNGADRKGWHLRASGSSIIPASRDAMSWRIGDHGFQMRLSRKVPGYIRENLRGWLEPWLATQGLGLEDVGSWAVHPGGPKILTAVEQALNLDAESLVVSREILRDFGNMSSPTILFIVEKLRAEGASLPCVALGFGPGLTVEAMLFD